MNEDKPLGLSRLVASRRVRAGARHYYIDAKSDSRGARYLVLSESKLREGGEKPERHRIFVYEEDFAKFFAAISQVLQELPRQEAGTTLTADEQALHQLTDLLARTSLQQRLRATGLLENAPEALDQTALTEPTVADDSSEDADSALADGELRIEEIAIRWDQDGE